MAENSTDIAIIGGGIIGLSCAYELARQSDARIVLFEKTNLASGTTGGSAGVICLHDMGEIYAQLSLAGFARIRQLRRDHGFEFNAWGGLEVIYAPATLPTELNPYERRFGGGPEDPYERQLLTRDQTLSRFPFIRPDHLVGSVFYPNQGFVDPYELVSLYEKLAVATGRVRIQRNTPVLAIETAGGRATRLITRKGRWDVGQILNAGGPWGAKIAAMAGSDLPLAANRVQVCLATGYDDGIDRFPISGMPGVVDGSPIWCRGEIGNTLVFGAHHHTTQAKLVVDPDHVNRINDPDFPSGVQSLVKRYWNVPKSLFLNGWCCVYGTTSDGFPILSPDVTCKNLFHAVGLNGHGMTCHAGVAMAVTEMMLRGGSVIDLAATTSKFERLDFGPLHMSRFGSGAGLTFNL